MIISCQNDNKSYLKKAINITFLFLELMTKDRGIFFLMVISGLTEIFHLVAVKK